MPANTTRFARSATSNPFGKCSAEVKCPIDEPTKEALTALAFASGVPLAEYVRSILHAHVHGHGMLLRVSVAPEYTREGMRQDCGE